MSQCQAKKSDGQRCRNKAQSGSNRCWQHQSQNQRGGIGGSRSEEQYDEPNEVDDLVNHAQSYMLGDVDGKYLNHEAIVEDLTPLASRAIDLKNQYENLPDD